MSTSHSMKPSPLAPASEQARRIRVISQRLAGACLVMIFLAPLIVPLYWMSAEANQLAVRVQLQVNVIEHGLSLWQRLTGALITEIPVALMLMGLWRARRCFQTFASGQCFSRPAVEHLQAFAGWMLASTLASILITPLLSVCLTFNNAPGAQHVAIGFSLDHVLSLFFAALVWLMASVIGQGQALAEENQSFV